MAKKKVEQEQVEQAPESKTDFLKLCIECLYDRGVSLTNRTLTFSEAIEEGSFAYFDAGLSLLESAGSEPIEIKLNSGGGMVYEAQAIVGRIKASPCQINVTVFGLCASAAVLILACGKNRKISKYSWFMIHEASFGLQGRHGEAADFIKQTDRERDQWAGWLKEFSGGKRDKKYFLELDKSRKDNYFTALEVVEMGLCDEII